MPSAEANHVQLRLLCRRWSVAAAANGLSLLSAWFIFSIGLDRIRKRNGLLLAFIKTDLCPTLLRSIRRKIIRSKKVGRNSTEVVSSLLIQLSQVQIWRLVKKIKPKKSFSENLAFWNLFSDVWLPPGTWALSFFFSFRIFFTYKL